MTQSYETTSGRQLNSGFEIITLLFSDCFW